MLNLGVLSSFNLEQSTLLFIAKIKSNVMQQILDNFIEMWAYFIMWKCSVNAETTPWITWMTLQSNLPQECTDWVRHWKFAVGCLRIWSRRKVVNHDMSFHQSSQQRGLAKHIESGYPDILNLSCLFHEWLQKSITILRFYKSQHMTNYIHMWEHM